MNYQHLFLKRQINIEGLYTFLYIENDKSFRSAGEKHNFWEFVYIDAGDISAISDNTGYSLNQGDVIFHKPMSFHSHAANHRKTNNILVVSFETQSPLMSFFADKIFTLNIRQKKLLSDFLEHTKNLLGTSFIYRKEGTKEFSSRQLIAYQVCISLLELFLLELISDNTYTSKRDKQDPDAKKIVETAFSDHIKEFLAENITNPLTLDDICPHFNVSKSYLCRLFKTETGKSIMDYFIDLKISEAKTLIREGELNFSQIAEKLSFSGIHDFSRAFRKKVNLSPTQYRKSIKRD